MKTLQKVLGSDAYCRDAAVTVEIAKSLIEKRRGSNSLEMKVE